MPRKTPSPLDLVTQIRVGRRVVFSGTVRERFPYWNAVAYRVHRNTPRSEWRHLGSISGVTSDGLTRFVARWGDRADVIEVERTDVPRGGRR